jgi:hypothetical protein
MFIHVFAHRTETTFTIHVIKGTIRKNMFGHFDVRILELASGHGAFSYGGVLVHPKIIHPEEFVFGRLMEIGNLWTEQTFFFHGPFIPVFVEVKIVFQTGQTQSFHGETGHLSIILVFTLKTNRLYRHHDIS